jgi:S-ribosylhomocysteine lyase LuxS involved in autoinducer biosynthesis
MTKSEVEQIVGGISHPTVRVSPFCSETGFYIEIQEGANKMRVPSEGEMPLHA